MVTFPSKLGQPGINLERNLSIMQICGSVNLFIDSYRLLKLQCMKTNLERTANKTRNNNSSKISTDFL